MRIKPSAVFCARHRVYVLGNENEAAQHLVNRAIIMVYALSHSPQHCVELAERIEPLCCHVEEDFLRAVAASTVMPN